MLQYHHKEYNKSIYKRLNYTGRSELLFQTLYTLKPRGRTHIFLVCSILSLVVQVKHRTCTSRFFYLENCNTKKNKQKKKNKEKLTRKKNKSRKKANKQTQSIKPKNKQNKKKQGNQQKLVPSKYLVNLIWGGVGEGMRWTIFLTKN